MALAVHGVVRASLDADVVAFAAVTQARELASGCQAAGRLAQLREGDHDDPIGALLAVEDAHVNRADVLFGLRGLDRSALTRAVGVHFEGVLLQVIGREDLIATKAYDGGPLDLQDARGLLAVDPDSVDRPLLLELAQRFGPMTLGRVRQRLGEPG